MDKNYKYLLHLSSSFIGDINTLTLNVGDEYSQPELYFKLLDDVLNICELISDDPKNITAYLNNSYFNKQENFLKQEKIGDKATTLLDVIFRAAKTNYINNKNWATIKLCSNIVSPKLETNILPISNGKNELFYLNSFIINNEIDDTKITSFSKAIDGDIAIFYNYYCNNSKDLLIATLDTIFRNKENVVIKRCENCNKLYIPKKLDTKYCDRISPQFANKTCKQAMDVEKKNESLNDPIKKLYKNVYNNLYTTYSNNKSKDNRVALQNFKKDNLKRAKQYKDKAITQEEYEIWLRTFYKRNRSDIE